jgi:hypothetical protein
MDEIRRQVEEHIALPRKERTARYGALPIEVKNRVRTIIEKRRGIAYRTNGGVIVRTQDELVKQIMKSNEKLKELPTRIETVKARMTEFKKQLQENYGDEALTVVEEALEAANA